MQLQARQIMYSETDEATPIASQEEATIMYH